MQQPPPMYAITTRILRQVPLITLYNISLNNVDIIEFETEVVPVRRYPEIVFNKINLAGFVTLVRVNGAARELTRILEAHLGEYRHTDMMWSSVYGAIVFGCLSPIGLSRVDLTGYKCNGNPFVFELCSRECPQLLRIEKLRCGEVVVAGYAKHSPEFVKLLSSVEFNVDTYIDTFIENALNYFVELVPKGSCTYQEYKLNDFGVFFYNRISDEFELPSHVKKQYCKRLMQILHIMSEPRAAREYARNKAVFLRTAKEIYDLHLQACSKRFDDIEIELSRFV